MDYSRDLVIGNGPQGPFDHFQRLKRNIHNNYREKGFDPSGLFLYAVTDSRMNKKWGHSISDAVKDAVEGGATIVQLRFEAVALLKSNVLIFTRWCLLLSLLLPFPYYIVHVIQIILYMF